MSRGQVLDAALAVAAGFLAGAIVAIVLWS